MVELGIFLIFFLKFHALFVFFYNKHVSFLSKTKTIPFKIQWNSTHWKLQGKSLYDSSERSHFSPILSNITTNFLLPWSSSNTRNILLKANSYKSKLPHTGVKWFMDQIHGANKSLPLKHAQGNDRFFAGYCERVQESREQPALSRPTDGRSHVWGWGHVNKNRIDLNLESKQMIRNHLHPSEHCLPTRLNKSLLPSFALFLSCFPFVFFSCSEM